MWWVRRLIRATNSWMASHTFAKKPANGWGTGIMLGALAGVATLSAQAAAQTIDLPTSKQLIGEIPGKPERLNSLPMTMAVSPDGRYVVTVNAGYGTAESHYEQSLAVLDTQTGQISDFPDARTLIRMKQTLYSGLAFSRDGTHIYASIGSLTDPQGTGKDDTGSGIVVYGFATGKGKFLAAHFDPPRATKMEPSHHTPQAQPARFDAET